MTPISQPRSMADVSSSTRGSCNASFAMIAPTGFPHDVVVLLDVLARIERRRQARLWALRLKEAS
jgi:hypothetical protein